MSTWTTQNSGLRAQRVFFLSSTLCILSWAAHAAEPLLQQNDLVYQGSFRLPSGTFGSPNNTFDYSGCYASGNVYDDPVNGKSLFITGYLSAGYVSNSVSVAQVKIPSTLKDP